MTLARSRVRFWRVVSGSCTHRLRAEMLPVTVSITIDAPRERVFELIGDLAKRPAFTDHFIEQFRLERIPSTGVGAAARFRTGPPGRRVWMETVIEELEPPHRILEGGHGGRMGPDPGRNRVGAGRRSRVHYRRIADLLDRAVTSHRSTQGAPRSEGLVPAAVVARAPPDAGSDRVGQPRRAARRRGRRPDPRPATRGPALGAMPAVVRD